MTRQQRTGLIVKLTHQQLERIRERTPSSLQLCRGRGMQVMPLGVPTNVATIYPHALAVSHGEGAYLTDIDGNRYCDYGAGYGALPVGHAHPQVVAAVTRQAARGTHFGAVTQTTVAYAEHLCDRFGLDWVRFSASGTEATMDALRLARAHTGRSVVVRAEGSYHGAHPDGLLSINQDLVDEMGPDDAPVAWPVDRSLPANATENVRVIAFNDLDAAEAALSSQDAAALIIEPIMFNVGAIEPGVDGSIEAGRRYLQGLRDLCDAYGTLLVFDEVKTAATVAWGGAQELYGVAPHLKTFAKAVCGGLPGGAVGDTDGRTFELVESQDVMHVGTLSGNPLTAAAGLAALTRVLTPEAYAGFDAFARHLRAGVQQVIDRYGLDAYVMTRGAKGCIVWAPQRLADFRQYNRLFDADVAFACWAFMANEGIWFPHGHDEQFTVSVCHGPAEAQLFVDAFDAFAQLLDRHGLAGG